MNKRDIAIYTGQWLKNARSRKGYTQQEVSIKANKNKTWYTDIERARSNVSWNDMIILSDILDFDISELLAFVRSHDK